MNRYSELSDDFYINLSLNTEMELSHGRETILHYFERLQKNYPTMRNFYCRDKTDFVLEEDKDGGRYRWCTVENRRICSGQVNPDSVEQVMDQHRLVLESIPYMLSISPLDCESLDLLYGFDFTYRGNHSQLVAEALGISPALERMIDYPGARIVSHEPSITLTLDENCRTQCRVSIETRTNAFHVRTGEFPEEQLSVYVSARQYGSLQSGQTYVDTLERLSGIVGDIVENYVSETVLAPLQRAIALR
jgi:hypothetical protein